MERRLNERLPEGLFERVLERLGLTAPPPLTLEGLNRLYVAWCRAVPFDNVRKRIAMASGERGPLPGGKAPDFFSAWLRHGTGGTCWPTSNALYSIVSACGFAARRVSGSMRDMGKPNHGSVKVRLEEEDYLVDSSMLVERALPLGLEKLEIPDPLHPVTVEPLEETWRLLIPLTMSETPLSCRLLDDPVNLEFYLDRYEWSRTNSPFNQGLFARRNFEGSVTSFIGPNRFVKDSKGVTQTLLDPEALGEALVSDLGLSSEIVAQLAAHDALS